MTAAERCRCGFVYPPIAVCACGFCHHAEENVVRDVAGEPRCFPWHLGFVRAWEKGAKR
jgi:hypothetical protein